MAALKGVNVTKIDAGTSGSNMIDQGLVNAGLQVMTDTYDATVATGSSDTIDIAILPTGCKVQSVEVYYDADADASFAVGDSNDPDRYIAATAVSTAGKLESTLTSAIGYVIGTNTGDNRVQITVSGGAYAGIIKTRITFTR